MKIKNCKYDHLELADRFLQMAEKFLPYAADERCELDMLEATVRKNACGTIACHAGWAAVVLIDAKHGTEFGKGRVALANFLGFPNSIELKDWAELNPSIWGNPNGQGMFGDTDAFGMQDDNQNLAGVVKHYLLVAKNLMEIKE